MDPIKPIEQPVEPTYQVMPGQTPQTSHENSVQITSAPAVSMDTSNHRRLYYIVLGLILLAVLGVGGYFLLGVKKTDKTEQKQSSKLPKVWLNQYFNKEVCDDDKVCGDDADPENDGLKNYEEFTKATSPLSPDTDADGLADGDEIHIYKTDPALKFTDLREIVASSGWTDSVQIKGGYDPLTPALKFTDARNKQIADDTAKFGLHEPTKVTLTPTPPPLAP